MPLMLVAGALVLFLPVVALPMGIRMARGRIASLRYAYRNGLVAALLVFGLVAVTVSVTSPGTNFFGGTVDAVEAVLLGLLFGLAAGFAYFWAGLLALGVGLMLGGGRRWALVGAWVAVPVIASAGVPAYQAAEVLTRPGPSLAEFRQGTLTIRVSGDSLSTQQAAGVVQCEVEPASRHVQIAAGFEDLGADPPLRTAEGRAIAVNLDVYSASDLFVAIAVDGYGRRVAGAGTELKLDAAPDNHAATLTLVGLTSEYEQSDSWFASVTWDCPE